MLEKLDLFLESMRWPMTPPAAYGWFHILFTLGGFAVCAFAAWKLRKVSDKAARWILFSIGALLGLTEIYKQLFYYFAVNDNTYAWGDFPFQFCSVPMYICLIAPWLKPGKLQRGTEYSLTEIAFACGFSSQSYFSYVFKRRMQKTPREYIRELYNKYEL